MEVRILTRILPVGHHLLRQIVTSCSPAAAAAAATAAAMTRAGTGSAATTPIGASSATATGAADGASTATTTADAPATAAIGGRRRTTATSGRRTAVIEREGSGEWHRRCRLVPADEGSERVGRGGAVRDELMQLLEVDAEEREERGLDRTLMAALCLTFILLLD